jgi:hypothetical protein
LFYYINIVLEYGVSISSQPGLFTEVLEYGVSISSLPGLFTEVL